MVGVRVDLGVIGTWAGKTINMATHTTRHHHTYISPLQLGLFRAETEDSAFQGSEVTTARHVNLQPSKRLRDPGPFDFQPPCRSYCGLSSMSFISSTASSRS